MRRDTFGNYIPPNLQRPDQKAQKIIGDYTLTSHTLGKGQFGEVVLAKQKDAKQDSKDQKQFMACKIIKKANLNHRLQQNLKSEIGILSKIQHPNVIGLYDIQKTVNNFYLFMQYCNGGDLEELRELRGHFTEQEARFCLSQIVQGFKAINQMNVIHRDLKLANILVNFKDINMDRVLQGGLQLKQYKKEAFLVGHIEVVVADLGFAKEVNEGDMTETMCGTPLNMAPEILQGEKYDHKVDVWSLGTIFYEMLTGFTPFTGMNKGDLKKNLDRGNYMFPKHIKLSLEGLDFLNCCLQYNPHQRMSWDELVKHSYLNYDHTKFMNENPGKAQNDKDELLLSYNDESGIYSVIMQNDPHQKLNQQNAILINTKNPTYFQQTYEKTIMKNFQNFEQEQNKVLEANQQQLGKSILDQKFEDQDKDLVDDDLFGDFKIAQPVIQNQQVPSFNPYLADSNDMDSRGILADQIKPQIQQIKKQKPKVTVVENLPLFDQDKSGSHPMSDIEKKQQNKSKNSDFKQYGDHIIDYNKINNLGKQIEQKQSQIKSSQTSDHKVQNAVVNITGNIGKSYGKPSNPANDFEEVKHSEALEEQKRKDAEFAKLMEGVDDIGEDSYYPLMTNDPKKKKDCIIKINDQQLGDVFDPQNEAKFNLQSIIISENYFAPQANKKK